MLPHALRPLLATLATATALGAATAHAVDLRVLVAAGPRIDVSIPLSSTSRSYSGALGGTAHWLVGAASGHLTLDGRDSGSAQLFLPPASGSSVTVNGVAYRGGVYLRLTGNGVRAINVVNLEDYLRSVVAAEMPPSWPTEALRAQAVIARTYAVAHLSPSADYDLCATEQCQVYPGVTREVPSTDAAVAATTAQVVSWQGQAARTYFSSDSGGYTASSQEVWNTPEPYLVAKPDPASRSPKSSWTLQVPLAKVAQIVARYRLNVGTLQGVSVTRVSASGRPQEIGFVGSAGRATLNGAEAGGFLRALGAYSTRVNLGGTDPLIVAGAGNGHGVGLSQYGASGLAGQNWNYLQILGFYYPGASISALQEAGATRPPSLAQDTPLDEAGRALAARQDTPAQVAPSLTAALELPGAL